MANVYATKNGNWSDTTVWNTAALPTSADDVFTNNFTVNMDTNATILSLRNTASAPIVAGGSFNFNTAGVSVTCTSTSASLGIGAANLITATNTTGTVTLNISSRITAVIANSQVINITGNGNVTVTGLSFQGGASIQAGRVFTKTGSGLLTVNADMLGGLGGSGTPSSVALNNSLGNVVINGNLIGGQNAGNHAVTQTAGNITITGNIFGGTGGAVGISFSGTQLTVNGNVNSGIGNSGIDSSAATNNITGTVTAGNVAAITSTSANTINVTGDVYASATAVGISSTNANGVVNLTGNMYNGLGRNAIYCQNVFISNTATTLWRMDTGGGDYKFLYSADSTPNLPAASNVRNGVTFGPALSLTGTMVVPAASDVRKNVVVDNTVGTGELTSADIISGINASSDSLAVRLKNILTDKAAGNIISQYKDA